MSNTKKTTRYWYAKIDYDYFEKHHMKIIRSFNNGLIKELAFYKMLVHSAKHRGYLKITEDVPYTLELLASVLDIPLDILKEGIEEFEEIGLLETKDDGSYFMEEGLKISGSESESAERVRRHRESKKSETLHSNKNVTKSNDIPKLSKHEVNLSKVNLTKILSYVSFYTEKNEIKLNEEQVNEVIEKIKKNINFTSDEVAQKYVDKVIKNYNTELQNEKYLNDIKIIFKKYYKNISSRFTTTVARKKINIAIKNGHDIDEIKYGFENYLKSNVGVDIQYIKNFATFMNQETWREYLEYVDEDSDNLPDLDVGVKLY